MEELKESNTEQFVVFKLEDEEYGADIQKVTIIEKMATIARVPKTPDYIKGVMNLRGDIIPIMDLRKKLNLPEVDESDDTRVVIVKIGDISAGMIVDSVVEVVQLTEDSIESLANFSSDISLSFILGVGKIEDRIVTLLDLEKLVKIQD
jgi:purine-binding chemotaxis protein CheW